MEAGRPALPNAAVAGAAGEAEADQFQQWLKKLKS